MELRPLREGSQVTAGTVLGRIGKTDELAPHVHFAIRPAGRGAPKIDPKPILDGWKLLEATAIYRAAGKNPFDGTATASQVLLMSKDAADRARPRRPAASRSTPAAARTSRPARSTAASWRCSSTWSRAAST